LKFDNKIAYADSLLVVNNYQGAIAGYQDALSIKSTETYPTLQINYITREMAYQKDLIEKNEKLDAYNLQIENRKKYRHFVLLGDKSMVDKNYEAAKQQYSEALSFQPQDEYAKQKLKIANHQLELLNPTDPEKPIGQVLNP
jgi:tetratricopeptide (TPR) repeat protein